MRPKTARGRLQSGSSSDLDPIASHLRAQLEQLGCKPGDRLLPAFSGGPDSLALLAACVRIRDLIEVDLHVCHVDHGLDAGSEARAVRARQLAGELGVAIETHFHAITLATAPGAGESLEAWARNQRYAALSQVAGGLGGAWIVTAHHAGDQAETLILRLKLGSGLRGMGGIRARRGRLLRPLLGLTREDLSSYVADLGLQPILDPTNLDLKMPRNRIRHRLLHEWKKEEPGLESLLCRVASLADRVIGSTENRLAGLTGIRPLGSDKIGRDVSGAQMDRQAFQALPRELQNLALSALDRTAKRSYPSSRDTRSELFRQLGKASGVVSCDAGAGWRWYSDRQTLRLLAPSTQPLADFTYTLRAPGSIDLVEIGLRATITRGAPAPWMFESHDSKTAFCLKRLRVETQRAAGTAPELRIRNRRAGDRIRPFGSRRTKKLKDLMIDQRIPRESRDRFPVLVADEQPIWVSGVTLDDRCRIEEGATSVWILELRALDKHTAGDARPTVEPALDIFPQASLAAGREKGSRP